MDKRGIKGGDQWRTQDEDEKICSRTLDVTDVGTPTGAVTNYTMAVATYPEGVDVTAAVTSGAMGVLGQTISLLCIEKLTKGQNYCVVIRYTKDGNNLENRFYIACPDEEP